MGRAYAAVLGPLACAVVLLRGLARGETAEAALGAATLALFAFAALGAAAGWAAGRIVEDAVRGRLATERQAAERPPGATRPGAG